LILVGLLLSLLSRELGPLGERTSPAVPCGWVCLSDPEAGSRFHPFQAGQVLGTLVANELPGLVGLLDDRCRRVPLDTGTEIRLARIPGSRERGCTVFPLPERCRYLLGMPINVNRALVEDLELLPGIGPTLATRIVEVRDSIGPFSSPEEFLRIPGIGKKLVKRMQGRVCF
jgi:competence ComEA-like helix-hairpin-helix protein